MLVEAALVQVQDGNTSENSINETRQIKYSCQAIETTSKVYTNIMNSSSYRKDTIFINFKNSKTSDPHRALLNLLGNINKHKKGVIHFVAQSNLTIYYP